MLFYILCCNMFFINASAAKHDLQKEKKELILLSHVIQNASKSLQEIIAKFQQTHNWYKSQENFYNVQRSLVEIDKPISKYKTKRLKKKPNSKFRAARKNIGTHDIESNIFGTGKNPDQDVNNTPRTTKAKDAQSPKKGQDFISSAINIDGHKRLFKTRILRRGYGDACTKNAINKCFKACKAALRTSCRVRKCKSGFEDFLKEKAKTGCNDAFGIKSTPNNNTTTKPKIEPVVDETINNEKPNFNAPPSSDSSADSDDTRKRMVVLQTIRSKNLINNLTTSIMPRSDSRRRRDKLENACVKSSRSKCYDVCVTAFSETCENYECNKSMPKQYRSYCKRQCKVAFVYTGTKTDSSSDDTDSSKSDSSDTDSD